MNIELLDPAKLATLAKGKEHNDGGGLYLSINANGSASWKFRKDFRGEPLRMGLGSLTVRSIDEARDLAAKYRRMIRDDIDPRLEEVTEGKGAGGRKTSPLFEDLFRQVKQTAMQRPEGGKQAHEKAVEKWQRDLDVYSKPLHGKQVHTITVADVVATLEPMWLTIPTSAAEFRGRLERVFRRWIASERAKGNVAVIINPATKEMVEPFLAKQPKGSKRRPSLSYKLLPAFFAELVKINTVASKALQAVILTCARTNEGFQMDDAQIVPAEDGGMKWKIPGKVMKNGLQADVPLTDTVIALIEQVKRERPTGVTLVFPGNSGEAGTLSENTLLAVVQKQLGYNGKKDKPRASTHGFRSTFRSWGMNETNHSRETLEFCLHHIEGSDAELAYAQGDMFEKRRKALEDWETYCLSAIAKKNSLRLVA
ncbi:integrase arm-type DNA-binding domain-containing protein [Bradyrhizobium japonicum]|uniref:tyrosine-type recombinase/integrase n=1 Tax=Bradyrhizobium japonicum TaxID=375 RepID=UPI002714C1AA|nr:integrase arm-type DNA-binding domain-containing protein [Bradyrhizobium japonicum]WLB24978.1 integrase arm-type DNA-binding domain-containing protein [Bradyrhizobium japonicum]